MKQPYVLEKEITPRGSLIRPRRSPRVDRMKTCITVTLTEVYLDALDRLVEKGVYVSQQSAIRDALRYLLRFQRMEPFSQKEDA